VAPRAEELFNNAAKEPATMRVDGNRRECLGFMGIVIETVGECMKLVESHSGSDPPAGIPFHAFGTRWRMWELPGTIRE
jgi:hypothetical protein